jgi:hypothetical protein
MYRDVPDFAAFAKHKNILRIYIYAYTSLAKLEIVVHDSIHWLYMHMHTTSFKRMGMTKKLQNQETNTSNIQDTGFPVPFTLDGL